MTAPKKTRKKPGPQGKRLSKALLDKITEAAAKGFNQDEIAKAIGWCSGTWKRHKEEGHPHSDLILMALKKGRAEFQLKELQDIRDVENALKRKATGWESTETRVEKVLDKKTGEMVVVKEVTVTKTQAPSDLAIFFYLVNRAGHRWQSVNKSEPEQSGPETPPQVMKIGDKPIVF